MENRKDFFFQYTNLEIQKVTQSLNIKSIFEYLRQVFILRFNIRKLLQKCYISHLFSFTREVYRFILGAIQSHADDQTITEFTIQCSQNIKVQYCKMVRKIKKEELYEEIDKMFMLISLSSRRFFEILMGKVYGSYEEQSAKNQITIESYTYMIIIHQTTGNMVSPYAFNCLKKKYVKKVLFKSTHKEEDGFGMIRSLKFIEKQLSKKDVLLRNRNQDLNDTKGGRKKKFHHFLKSALKIDYDGSHNKQKNTDEDQLSSNFQKLLCENKVNNKEFKKMNNLIVSRPKNIEFNKISEAMKFNYQLEDKGKKFMLSFMEKLKSKSLSSKKQWRHTLSQNYNFQKIAKLTHQERKSNAEISKIKRNWPVLVKRMRGEKQKRLSVQKFNPNINYISRQPAKVSFSQDLKRDVEKKQVVKVQQPTKQCCKIQVESQKQVDKYEFINLKENTKDEEKVLKRFPKVKRKTHCLLKKKKRDFEKERRQITMFM